MSDTVNDDKALDFRSDTVTRPSLAMRNAMYDAEVGDDALGDDPSVTALEHEVAGIAGKESGLYFPSGTQSNLAAMMAHCGRGDEYIVGQEAHIYRYEGGGAAVLGSIQPQPIENDHDGSIPLHKVQAAIKPAALNFARTRLLALENTITGRVLSAEYIAAASAVARAAGLAFHLDGARAWHAAVATAQPLAAVVAPFDTVSLCLSKGLGAPVGSVLVGPHALLQEARRWRKVLGGAMRQSGLLAAAGSYAVRHNAARLAEDHANAAFLADGLRQLFGNSAIRYTGTNMVLVSPLPGMSLSRLAGHLAGLNIKVSAGQTMRLVTHLDVSRYQVGQLVEGMKQFLRENASSEAA